MRRFHVLFLSLSVVSLSQAAVKMPAIFGDHMVLQRDNAVPVWGWADPGEAVTVSIGSIRASTTTGTDGRWAVKLGKLPASTKAVELTVTGKNTLTFTDVLIGDVWVCSGQSNMEMGIKAFMPQQELNNAGEPLIRLFSVPKWVAPAPATDVAPTPENLAALGKWQLCTPEMLMKAGEWSGFPAVGFYFGREIQKFTRQPVGLIGSCWGGTRINSWTSLEMLQAIPAMASHARSAAEFRDNYAQIKKTWETVTEPQWKETLAKWNEENKGALDAYAAEQKQWGELAKAAAAEKKPAPKRPVPPKPPRAPVDPVHSNQTSAALFNGMISPLIPYAIRGVVWYQGESNGDQPAFYNIALPGLIKDWRKHWGQGDFPFLVVQLPNYMAAKPTPSESTWAGVREAQAKAAQTQPSTGIAVTIDLGEAGNIHPADKYDVGRRLALVARKVAYGQQDGVTSGPVFKGLTVDGAKVRVTFTNTGGGLVLGNPPDTFFASQKKPAPKTRPTKLEGFAIAGADNKFVWADAVIEGDSVVLTNASVPKPVSVRYAWADNPVCNLYNKEDLPAAPFRTDEVPFTK